MKEFFTEREQALIREAHHGGLKFELFQEDIKILQCYRTTISGGLDYCNNQVDKIQTNKTDVFTVRIYDRHSAISRNNWRPIGYLQRTKETLFNH